MPIALPSMVGAIAPQLLAAGLLGTDTPKLASGVANGLQQWVPTISIQTVDAGTLGVGVGGPIPVLIPQQVLFLALSATIPPAGFLGPFMPSLVVGLANGLALTFPQMLVVTQHPVIGTGAAVAKFLPPPAGPLMTAGFSTAGLIGESAPKLANAIGLALDSIFASLVIPVPIVGTVTPTGGGGSGTGQII